MVAQWPRATHSSSRLGETTMQAHRLAVLAQHRGELVALLPQPVQLRTVAHRLLLLQQQRGASVSILLM